VIRHTLERVGLGRLDRRISFARRMGWRYQSLFPYTEIEGWLSEKEAVSLYEMSRRLENRKPVVVEIGSWLGKSSFLLALGLKHRGGGTLYCIDPFNADGDADSRTAYQEIASTLPVSLQQKFEQTMKGLRVDSVIKVLPGYSSQFAPSFSEAIDLLFIDGDHQYEGVLRDYREWSPHIKAGGVLAFHDVGQLGNEPSDGPSRVVTEEVLKNASTWTDFNQIDSLFVARKQHS